MCEDCLCDPAAGLMSVFLFWWSRCFSSLPCPCLEGVYAVKSYIERCSYLLFKAPFVCFPSFSGTSLHQDSGRYSHITNVGSGRTDFQSLPCPLPACFMDSYVTKVHRENEKLEPRTRIPSGLFMASCIAQSALIIVELIQHWTAPICCVVFVFLITSLSLALICWIANIWQNTFKTQF